MVYLLLAKNGDCIINSSTVKCLLDNCIINIGYYILIDPISFLFFFTNAYNSCFVNLNLKLKIILYSLNINKKG